jgi:P pilus assembly chaperone PapD
MGKNRIHNWVRPALRAGLLIVCTILLCIPLRALSAQASLLIHPTLITFEGTKRTHSVAIINRGDATGVFEISWVDFSMTPEGGLKGWQTPPPWSLQPYVRYSPRRVTLRPGEDQVIKIALRRMQEVSEGEYLSHLKVLTIHESDDVASGEGNAKENEQTPGVVVTVQAGMTIPVVWRNTSATPGAMIDFAQINPEKHEVIVDVRRLGILSIRGYIHVFHRSADGLRSAIAKPFPLVIYQNLDKRTASVPLNPDVVLSPDTKGSIEISYSENLQNQGSSLASYHLEF